MPAGKEGQLLASLGQPDADAPTQTAGGTNDSDPHWSNRPRRNLAAGVALGNDSVIPELM